MTYYNKQEDRYYHTGTCMVRRLADGTLWSGEPTSEQLTQWGYALLEPEPVPEPDAREQRMQEILAELAATDYLALKAFEGEDMTEHPGWKEHRAALRSEYRELESSGNISN